MITCFIVLSGWWLVLSYCHNNDLSYCTVLSEWWLVLSYCQNDDLSYRSVRMMTCLIVLSEWWLVLSYYQNDELSFEEGDLLYIQDSSNKDWWKARCGSKTGLIPSNYGNTDSLTVCVAIRWNCHDLVQTYNMFLFFTAEFFKFFTNWIVCRASLVKIFVSIPGSVRKFYQIKCLFKRSIILGFPSLVIDRVLVTFGVLHKKLMDQKGFSKRPFLKILSLFKRHRAFCYLASNI